MREEHRKQRERLGIYLYGARGLPREFMTISKGMLRHSCSVYVDQFQLQAAGISHKTLEHFFLQSPP